jgi:hypothetical protein
MNVSSENRTSHLQTTTVVNKYVHTLTFIRHNMHYRFPSLQANAYTQIVEHETMLRYIRTRVGSSTEAQIRYRKFALLPQEVSCASIAACSFECSFHVSTVYEGGAARGPGAGVSYHKNPVCEDLLIGKVHRHIQGYVFVTMPMHMHPSARVSDSYSRIIAQECVLFARYPKPHARAVSGEAVLRSSLYTTANVCRL